ncbi:MAG: glycosyltransferase family 2 protein, partial [Planctomycetes bacterium]|nr:glycosyltransferase family 2 protein [Planctomycetota bacterium]
MIADRSPHRSGPTPASSNDDGGAAPFVSVVIPARHEEDNVQALVDRLRRTLSAFTDSFEIIFVCDGFEDRTCDRVRQLRERDERIKLLLLSRSFGHQNALLAGLDHATGRVVITMDADLQHPPEAVADLLVKWEDGYDVVHAIRRPSRDDGFGRRRSREIAYAILRRLCEADIVPQSADFKLYDRTAVTALCRLREQGRFNRGLAGWIGFRQAAVSYDEASRTAGQAEYSFTKRVRLLMNGVFSLSSKPLQYLGVAGLSISAMSLLYLVVILIGWAAGVEGYREVSGWASTVAIVLFVSGVQLVALWLMGQYLARTYDQAKGRPCYIVADAAGIDCADLPPDAREPHRLPRRQAVSPAADPIQP